MFCKNLSLEFTPILFGGNVWERGEDTGQED